MELDLSPADTLPEDGTAGTLIGRAWKPGGSSRRFRVMANSNSSSVQSSTVP